MCELVLWQPPPARPERPVIMPKLSEEANWRLIKEGQKRISKKWLASNTISHVSNENNAPLFVLIVTRYFYDVWWRVIGQVIMIVE